MNAIWACSRWDAAGLQAMASADANPFGKGDVLKASAL